MFWGGITSFWYSNPQYQKFSTKVNALVLSLFTVVMLFFMADPGKYLKSAEKFRKTVLHIAGYAGISYVALSSIDAVIRSKFPSVRIFDELGIVAAYMCLWCLMALIFKQAAFGFLTFAAVAVCVVVGLGAYYERQRIAREANGGANDTGVDKQASDLIDALSKSNSPAAATALTIVALYAAITHPEDPATQALVKIAMTIGAPVPPQGPEGVQDAEAVQDKNKKASTCC